VRGGFGAVLAQLDRYAQNDRIETLILCTTKSTLARVPTTLNGKAVLAAVILPGL